MKDDAAYGAYFENRELVGEFDESVKEVIAPPRIKKRVGPPDSDDWSRAKVFVNFLEGFYEVTLSFSSSLKPTTNTCFHDIMVIESKLRDLYVPITNHVDSTKKRSELDEYLSTMSLRMTAKYDKYFRSHNDMNQLLFVALFLDPRFKLTTIGFFLEEEGMNEVDVKKRTNEIITRVKEIYDCYKPPDIVCPFQSSNSRSTVTSTVSSKTVGTKNKTLMSLLQKLPVNDGDIVSIHEVERYLGEKTETFSDGVELDILLWWKYNGPRLPVLAAMAKDILDIQVSSVASDSSFSTGGRIVDTSRSSLTPKSVETVEDTKGFAAENCPLII